MKQRIALLVYVDLSPVPGEFDTADLAREKIASLLQDLARNEIADHLEHKKNKIDLYNPIVAHAPDSLQPPNHPRNMEDSGEIPRFLPVAGRSIASDTDSITVEFPQTTPLDDRTWYDD